MKKWRNIKDTYIKTLKKPKSGSGSSNKGRQYLYAKQLAFLQQSSLITETESSLNSEHPVSDEDNDESRGVASDMDYDQSNPPPYNNHFNNNSSKRKRDLESSLLASTNFLSVPSTTPTVQSHPDQSFFESIVPILNGFTEEEVIDFRIEVLSIIKKIKKARKCTRQTPSHFNCIKSSQPGTHMTYPQPHLHESYYPSSQPSTSSFMSDKLVPPQTFTGNSVRNLSTSKNQHHNAAFILTQDQPNVQQLSPTALCQSPVTVRIKAESRIRSPENISQNDESYNSSQHSASPPLTASSSIHEAEGSTDDECLN